MREPSSTTDRPTRPKPADRVVERIEEIVRLRTGGMIRGLRVEVGENRVVLTGRTSSFYSKQLATHAALGALGGQTLSNLIEVN
ncbi:MAG TPA: BON domain-containing protein [Planctomycetaceae bacterium]